MISRSVKGWEALKVKHLKDVLDKDYRSEWLPAFKGMKYEDEIPFEQKFKDILIQHASADFLGFFVTCHKAFDDLERDDLDEQLKNL